MSIRWIRSNYNKLDCYDIIRFLLDLAVVDLENIEPYIQGNNYLKGEYIYLKENGIHKIYRCKSNLSSHKFIPSEWEHVMSTYDKEFTTNANIFFREYDFIVDENNIDNIADILIIPDYKIGISHANIYIGKEIFIQGTDFIIDENGKISFNSSVELKINDKIIVEVKDIIGLPDRVILLSSNGNNYEIGAISNEIFIIPSDLKYANPEIFIRDIVTGENYKIYMLDEDVYFELTDLYTIKTEIKVLDENGKYVRIEMVDGDLLFENGEKNDVDDDSNISNKLILLGEDANYEIGIVNGMLSISKTDETTSVSEVNIIDEETNTVYKLFMISDMLCYEPSDVFAETTEIYITDDVSQQHVLKIIGGKLVLFSPMNNG